MITREHSVKELHFTFDRFPHLVFKVQAETPEKAAKKLIADLKASVVEVSEHQKGQQNKPTQQA